MQRLTARQQQVLEYIRNSIAERGYPPTLREIGAHMGIRSTNGVNDHLRALERKGYLTREDMKSRAIKPRESSLVSRARKPSEIPAEKGELLEVPVLGQVAAGEPIFAEENVTDTLRIDLSLVGSGEDVFALRVTGDSMIEAGIHSGDYIFVRKQHAARRGDIVVALIGDEATVKYFHPEKDYVRFQPANARMAPIIVRSGDFKQTMILGVVAGLYRRF